MSTIGKGSEYALHCLLYLIEIPTGQTLTVGDIAEFQGVSESYLAKIFTKLKKAKIVRSSIGAKGGYELARTPEQITFWDVVVAVEGEINFFECPNIRTGIVIYKNAVEKPDWIFGTCEIHRVMIEAEDKIKAVLKGNTLASLSKTVGKKIPQEDKSKISKWLTSRAGK